MAHYKLVTYGTGRAGIVVGEQVHDAAKATGKAAYSTVMGILSDWRSAPTRPCRKLPVESSRAFPSREPNYWLLY